MKYVRIDTAARDRVAHLVIVAEDPVAVLRDAARLAEEVLKPTGKAADAARPPRREVREKRTSSEILCSLAAQKLGCLAKAVATRLAAR
jgi:hypothetical protein